MGGEKLASTGSLGGAAGKSRGLHVADRLRVVCKFICKSVPIYWTTAVYVDRIRVAGKVAIKTNTFKCTSYI